MSITLDNVKILLGISSVDDSQDNLLGLYISRADNFVLNYCNFTDVTEIPATLSSVIEDIVVYKYRNKGVENLKSEGLGSHSASFLEGVPSDIIAQLNAHRRVRVI
jgi:hypothetical protein